MHYRWKTCALIIFIILSSSTNLFLQSGAQNCAIPHLVTLAEDCDVRVECAPSNTILAELSTKYVQSVKIISQTAPNFAEIKLANDTISLEVNSSLCPWVNADGGFNQSMKSYIDESWDKDLDVEVEFICTDGRTKNVKFNIPIEDLNTQSPKFESEIYNLTMGPCYNGTHQGACPLNFEYNIVAYDEDRDLKNAIMEFRTSNFQFQLNDQFTISGSNWIKITTSEMEIQSANKLKTNVSRYQQNVHLYLMESDIFSMNNSLTFDLTAYNNINSPTGQKLFGTTTVRVFFGETTPIEFPQILEPPKFTSSAYHATVTSLYDAKPGAQLYNIQPRSVSTFSTSTFGYGYGENEEGEIITRKIRYGMVSDIFKIEPDSGKIFYALNYSYEKQWKEVEISEIHAFDESYQFLNSSVPLLVFFNIQADNGTEGGCSTTTPSQCPECPTVCPPMDNTTTTICPIQTTESTTSEGGNYETTTTGNIITTDSFTEISDPSYTSSITDSISWPTTTTETSEHTTENSHTTSITDPISSTIDPSTNSSDTTDISDSSTTTSVTTEPSTSILPSSDFWTIESSTSTTTTELTTSSTTIEPIYSTPPSSGNTTCCNSCNKRLKDFKCPTEGYEGIHYPDSRDCSIFHQCSSDDRGGVIDTIQSCPSELIFCPQTQKCEYSNSCPECKATGNEDFCNIVDKQSCLHCDLCLNRTDPDNICQSEGYFPDPRFCDVYHQCRKDDFNGYIDCLQPCPLGLVWCQETLICDYYSKCPCEGKEDHYKCDLCNSKQKNLAKPFNPKDNKTVLLIN